MRILLVDDDLGVLEVISLQLRSEGHETFCASEGRQALAECARLGPDCVLLDGVMPGLSGTAVLKALKADPATRDIPVIFFSAESDPNIRKKALRLGAAGYLLKSGELASLGGDIQKILCS